MEEVLQCGAGQLQAMHIVAAMQEWQGITVEDDCPLWPTLNYHCWMGDILICYLRRYLPTEYSLSNWLLLLSTHVLYECDKCTVDAQWISSECSQMASV